MLKGKGDEDLESLEIDEIENVLENISSEVYIKESECLNVILVELGSDSVEVAKKLCESPTEIKYQGQFQLTVVKTSFESILTKVKNYLLRELIKVKPFLLDVS